MKSYHPTPRRRGPSALIAALVAGAMFTIVASCATYHDPPEATLVAGADNVLTDPTAPIVLTFSRPVAAKSMKITIARYVVDTEGNLPDEDTDPNTNLDVIFKMDGGAGEDADPTGGKFSLSPDGTRLTISLSKTPPVGPRLVILIEPGIADLDGNETLARRKVLFGYEFKCSDKGGGTQFASGAYFFLINLEEPIPSQIQLLGLINVDTSTGRFHGQFTNADRNSNAARCPQLQCAKEEVCRLLPSPACVPPSERAGNVDEFSEFVPNNTPPLGYSFTVDGCVEDQAGAISFAIVPADVVVQQPAVTVKGITLSASFVKGADGVSRGQGSVSAAQVYIGKTESGKAKGSMTARALSEKEAPPNIPAPPK